MREPLLLATIQEAILEFLRGRTDAVLFGAQAVNAYVDEPRMSQDVDLLSPRAKGLAEEIRAYLQERFRIAVRVREIGAGRGFRIYQIQKNGNRHLADIRPWRTVPLTQTIDQVLVAAPAELIAQKIIAYHQRAGRPKAFTDRRDLAMLLLKFPELKRESSAVRERLIAASADEAILEHWREIVAQEIKPPEDDDEF
ncbi:MAG: nucleotidyl transferase AbiEii/AbiGii toxin family protein [Chloroflexi bacterium]|nr:nucleotidyl transferase AbiEii/AbiGii toxin family protein [Chloroflexota bacterium]